LQNDPKGQFDWRNLFNKVEYVGTGEVEGRKVEKVKVETTAGMEMTNAYDAETFILLQTSGINDSPMGKIEFALNFKDYKDIHNGMLFAMRTEANMLNQVMEIKFNEVEVNVDIPDSKFALPAGLK
jgi:outer membrane lipoprotein-sorting protein